MGAKGTATIDFTSTPSEEAEVTVSGLTGFVVTSACEAFFMHNDTTSDNGADEHEEAAALCPLSCKYFADGSIKIKAMPIAMLGIGTFKVHYVWDI